MADFLIDDSTHPDILTPPGKGRGLDLSSRPRGMAYEGSAIAFKDEWLVDRAEWADRWAEIQKNQQTIEAICKAAGVAVLNQESTPYCWVNAPTWALMIRRLMQNEDYVKLSPASAGARIKGFRAVGGWGREAIEWIGENGVCPQDIWPANAISRQYDTPESREVAKKYRTTEWVELEPKNIDQLVSAILRQMGPISTGYNWWGHEVNAVGIKFTDSNVTAQNVLKKLQGRIANNWGTDWGDDGYGDLALSRFLPDDAVLPLVATAA